MRLSRLGRFYIDRRIIEDQLDRLLLHDIFREMVVVRAEMLYARDAIEYFAFHERFDEVQEGEEIPRYLLRLERRRSFEDLANPTFVVEFKGFERMK